MKIRSIRTPLQKFFTFALFIFLLSGALGCEDDFLNFIPVDTPFNFSPIPFNPGGDGDGDGDGDRECFQVQFTQPEAEISHTVDVLFVTDTSTSLNPERNAIANGISALVEAFPAEVDYRVGVMLAHGSLSAHSGALYQQDSEPVILNSNELTVEEIKTHLQSKLANPAPPRDWSADGGEEGLYSLSKSLDADAIAATQELGFYREDAALAVVFISDENDICARYPKGVVPVVDFNNLEGPAFDRDCANVTPMSVVEQLRALKGDQPLFLGGIVYNNLATVPNLNDEDEYGYGYLDAIALANGISVDLANPNFQEGLTDIGELVTVQLNLFTVFELNHANIDPTTIEILIDGNPVAFNFIPETNEVHLTEFAGQAQSVVEISYCEAGSTS
jgi:hypothetical protein